MIIDAHFHLIPNENGVETVLSYMREANIDRTILVPGGMVPLLGLGDYLRGRQSLLTTDPANDFVAQTVRSYPSKFAGFFQIDPSYHDEDNLAEAVSDGFIGFKFNPLVNRVSFLSEDVKQVCSFLVERNMPLYTHVVASGDASIDALEVLLNQFPDLCLILGHMGFAGTDLSAIRLAARFENVRLETSVGSFAAIQEAVKKLGSTKVIFGSEGPVHHPSTELRKIELLRLPAKDYENICYSNIASLIQWTVEEQKRGKHRSEIAQSN